MRLQDLVSYFVLALRLERVFAFAFCVLLGRCCTDLVVVADFFLLFDKILFPAFLFL